MSKVLIDRELLERAVYGLELAYESDTQAVRDICAVLSAPSGTPAMPVKAYYHESKNEYGGLNKSVGLEVRTTFIDAPLVLEADALARIACLEGEIAKRDEELAACRVAVENCEVFRARIVELEHRCGVYGLELHNATERLQQAERQIKAVKAQEPVAWAGVIEDCASLFVTEPQLWKAIPLYAAPVSDAKAQGVVMPAELDRAFITGESCDGVYRVVIQSETRKEMQAVHRWLASLNASHVQRVSVPDERIIPTSAELIQWAWEEEPEETRFQEGYSAAKRWVKMQIEAGIASPAAPAADAGLIEALGYQALFDAIAAATSVYANGAINISVQAFRDALTAHRAKGVV